MLYTTRNIIRLLRRFFNWCLPFVSTNGNLSDTMSGQIHHPVLIDIELYEPSSVVHHSRVKAVSIFVFCTSFLAPDVSRRLSRTMTSAPMAPCINEYLPEELFGVIFEEHAKLEWKAPLIDRQVCRQWRQTILCCPRAWAHLEIGENFTSAPLKLHQWLDRSGSAPLHIRAINWFWGVEKVLDQHCNRIHSLSLQFHSLSFLENRSFPILHSLTIDAWNIDTLMIRWSACSTMPVLRSLRASNIEADALPSNIFPVLGVLSLHRVNNCDSIIQNTSHSLTSLMIGHISLKYTSESLEFPSLRFLSLFEVKNIKHRMNLPALTTYHESGRTEEESFSMSLPSLIEYGIYRLYNKSPFNVTKLHQCYPNITRLSVRACPSNVKRFLHSLSGQLTALPMLRIFAVEVAYNSMQYSGEDKDSMMNDVSVRNMASSVKMELCFNGTVQFPLYFGNVRVCLSSGRRKLTSSFRSRTLPVDHLSFILLGRDSAQNSWTGSFPLVSLAGRQCCRIKFCQGLNWRSRCVVRIAR